MGQKTVKMPIGMLRSYWAPIASEPAGAHPTYGEKKDMGAARKGYLSVTTVTADVPGDDVIQVHIERFVSGTLDSETDCSDLELNASVYGHRYVAGEELSGKEDSAPNGGFAFIEPIMLKDRTTIYRATFLFKVCAVQSSEKTEADTRQPSGFDPKVNAVSYMVMADDAGDYRARQEFNSLAEAEAWLDGKFGSGNAYAVKVINSGDGASTPAEGTYFVTAGQNFVLDFGSEDPSALYDNGVEVTDSIATHKYTIGAIAAAHSVVAIWT